jgi:hypothetical protein
MKERALERNARQGHAACGGGTEQMAEFRMPEAERVH